MRLVRIGDRLLHRLRRAECERRRRDHKREYNGTGTFTHALQLIRSAKVYVLSTRKSRLRGMNVWEYKLS